MICDDLPINSMVDLPIAGPHTDLRPQSCTAVMEKKHIFFDPLIFFQEQKRWKNGMLTYDHHGKLAGFMGAFHWIHRSPAKINGI
jgi:hypothetical protein